MALTERRFRLMLKKSTFHSDEAELNRISEEIFNISQLIDYFSEHTLDAFSQEPLKRMTLRELLDPIFSNKEIP